MISDKQLEANRSNALKSTGPKTELGKSIASKNSTTHGLLSNHVVIKDESKDDFEDLRNSLNDYFQPVGILEQLLTNQIAASFWRLNRTGRIDVEMLNSMFTPKPALAAKESLPFIVHLTKTYDGLPGKYEEPIEEKPWEITDNDFKSDSPDPDDLTLGQAVIADFRSENLLERLHRYKSHIDKTLYKAIHELQRLQSTRHGHHAPAPLAMDIDINGPENPRY